MFNGAFRQQRYVILVRGKYWHSHDLPLCTLGQLKIESETTSSEVCLDTSIASAWPVGGTAALFCPLSLSLFLSLSELFHENFSSIVAVYKNSTRMDHGIDDKICQRWVTDRSRFESCWPGKAFSRSTPWHGYFLPLEFLIFGLSEYISTFSLFNFYC